MGKIEKGQQLTEAVERHVGELQRQLATGHSEHFLEALRFYGRFHRYSFWNTVLIYSQRPDATLVNGLRKWNELGFTVRGGERGIAIRAPWLRKEVDPDTGEKSERLIGYFAAYVFDISQTVEYPEKQPPQLNQEVPGDYEALYDHLVNQVGYRGVKLEERPLELSLHGYHDQGTIVINDRLSPYLKVTCLIHEFVHFLAHRTPEERNAWTKAEREWQAESVAYTVCAAIGVENVNSADYLLAYHLTTDKLAEMMKLIQSLTKQALEDLDLLQPAKEMEALAVD